MTTPVTAAVLVTPNQPFDFRDLELTDPAADEILVRIRATGICHTDIGIQPHHPLPAVLGHEGCGDVLRVGSAVTGLAPGDRVVLTFDSCGNCRTCAADRPAHCQNVLALNFAGVRSDGTTTLTDPASGAVHGSFFGQSSFATLALANERNAVRVSTDIDPALLAPLGCGIQTGAGTVINTLAATAGSSLVCFGIGAVGASAIMAAVLRGCTTIVAVDINAERLELARSLGATHTLLNGSGALARIRELTGGGADYAFDTAGTTRTFHDAIACTRIGGHTALAAIPNWQEGFHFHASDLALGRTVTGVLEGSSQPHRFIAQLVDWMTAGQLPVERLVRTYPFADINQALDDLRHSRVVKPVVLM